jgi:hypothetical protein
MVCKNEQMAELGGKNIRVTTAPADLTKPFPPKFRAPDGWQTREDPKREESRSGVESKGKMPSPRPWSGPIVGPGSSVQGKQWAEGPTLLKVGGEWRLYFDRFRMRADRFGLATSKDLVHWTDRTSELKVPPQAMHGTIFRAPRAVVLKAFSKPLASSSSGG